MAGPNAGTQIGHGQLGLRSNLWSMDDLLAVTDASKEVLVELRPVKEVTDWVLDTGSQYLAPFEFTYDDKLIDVVGVATQGNQNLTRAETSASLAVGRFFYDPSETFSQSTFKWDVANTTWDDGVLLWDQFPKLYIRLDDSSNPNNDTVVVKLGIFLSNKARSHPVLGSDLLTDGTLDVWSGGSLSNWALTGTGTETEVTSGYKDGSAALKLTVTSTNRVIETQSRTTISGAKYRLFGWYKSPASAAVAEITVDDGTNYLRSDGLNKEGSAAYLALGATKDVWRRFVFDFQAWTTTTNIRICARSVTGGDVHFDGVTLKRIWRFEYYEPRVSSGNIPTTDSGSQDIFFGGKRVSVGDVGFLNQDGYFESIVGQLEWMNQECLVKIAGEFHSEPQDDGSVADGQEILLDDAKEAFVGLIQHIEVTDNESKFDIEDQRSNFHRKLPKNVYDDQTFPNLAGLDWQGKPRPIFFGQKLNITPARIDYEATYNKYGVYEICDCTDAPNGIKAVDKVYAYTAKDKTTASVQTQASVRVALTETTHYTTDLPNGRFTIVTDVGPYEVEAGVNDKLNFSEGGAELTATLTEALYTAASLASHIQTVVRAVGAGDENCSYSDSVNQFTLSKDAGTFALKVTSGTNKDRSIFKTIGFTTERTGALTYIGDEATFTSAENDHVIRCNAQGYKDDASGTYTGVVNALIEVGAHICKVLLIKFMGKPSTIIDTDSFDLSASRAPESLAIFMSESTSTMDVFTNLEYSNIANIVIDGSGKVRYKVYIGTDATEKATLTHVLDRDIANFSGAKDSKETFKTVRINYNQDPSTKIFQAREATDASVPVRLGRPDLKEFNTYLRISDNAINAAGRMLELARKSPRTINMTVLGGKLMNHEVGDKIRLTRRRGIGSGGRIEDEVFRIVSIRKNYLKGAAEVELTDDRVTVASTACISACQSFCESSCQEPCELACQDVCRAHCEDVCEVSCEGACQATCQGGCEVACKTGCETSCQTACQTGCQACEGGGCQTACEASCQTACELACQVVCETSCRLACQVSCQTGCRVTCEDTCRLTCQETCRLPGNCQDACELHCQTGCEITCQTGCQAACQTPSEQL